MSFDIKITIHCSTLVLIYRNIANLRTSTQQNENHKKLLINYLQYDFFF